MQMEPRRHGDSTVARCVLARSESMLVNSRAIRACSAGVTVRADTAEPESEPEKRSLWKMVRDGPPPPRPPRLPRVVAEAPVHGGWIELAPVFPGDIVALPVDARRSYVVGEQRWIGYTDGVDAGPRPPQAGVTEGSPYRGVAIQGPYFSGYGQVVVGAYGGAEIVDLAARESLTVEESYVIAYDPVTDHSLRRMLSPGKVFVDFSGPGHVVLQARSPKALEAWARSVVPRQGTALPADFTASS